jgi:hypothetical protein
MNERRRRDADERKTDKEVRAILVPVPERSIEIFAIVKRDFIKYVTFQVRGFSLCDTVIGS